MPEHLADSTRDPSNPSNPEHGCWKQRPAEVSRAIDAMDADPALVVQLQLDSVVMQGISA